MQVSKGFGWSATRFKMVRGLWRQSKLRVFYRKFKMPRMKGLVVAAIDFYDRSNLREFEWMSWLCIFVVAGFGRVWAETYQARQEHGWKMREWVKVLLVCWLLVSKMGDRLCKARFFDYAGFLLENKWRFVFGLRVENASEKGFSLVCCCSCWPKKNKSPWLSSFVLLCKVVF